MIYYNENDVSVTVNDFVSVVARQQLFRDMYEEVVREITWSADAEDHRNEGPHLYLFEQAYATAWLMRKSYIGYLAKVNSGARTAIDFDDDDAYVKMIIYKTALEQVSAFGQFIDASIQGITRWSFCEFAKQFAETHGELTVK